MRKLLLFLLLLIPINVYGIDTSAKSSILMDMDTKRVLYGENINYQQSVASISKIMTAILAIESGKMDDIVVVGDEIDNSYGSGIYIKKGEKITLRDLVYGLMLRSGNDASYAIAHHVAGDEFVDLMNKKAKELGMINTIFNNPNGLDEESGNYSTVYDMAILTSYAMKNEEYKKIVSTKQHTLKTNMNTYVWFNKHKLLFSLDYVTGGKTGFTQKAKRTLVTTAKKNNLNLVAVTLNDGNDFIDHKNMFEYGFANFYKTKVIEKGYLTIQDTIYYNKYNLKIKKNFTYTFHNNDKVYLQFNLDEKPKEGKVGEVEVILNKKMIYKDNIYAEKVVRDKLSLWERIKKIW